MAFAPAFSRPVSPAFYTSGSAGPWWLSGGIASANAIAVYQPKGAASLAASYTNLANPGTYTAAPGTAPTLGASGWTFNGTTQHLVTGIMTASGMSYIVRFDGGLTTSADRAVFGGVKSSGAFDGIAFQATLSGATDKHQYVNGQSPFLSVAFRTSGGIYAANTTNGYVNGVSDGTLNNNTIATSTEIYIGALRLGTTSITQYWSGNITALAFYNTSLSGAQILALTNAIAAL